MLSSLFFISISAAVLASPAFDMKDKKKFLEPEEILNCIEPDGFSHPCIAQPHPFDPHMQMGTACMSVYSPKMGFKGDCWEQQTISLVECQDKCIMDNGMEGANFCCCTTNNCNHPENIIFI